MLPRCVEFGQCLRVYPHSLLPDPRVGQELPRQLWEFGVEGQLPDFGSYSRGVLRVSLRNVLLSRQSSQAPRRLNRSHSRPGLDKGLGNGVRNGLRLFGQEL